MKTNKSKYTKDSGFRVPEDYFSNLEIDVFACMENPDFLDIKETGHGFSTPPGYFENFEDRVMMRVKKSDSKVITLFRKEYFYYAAAVAAMLVLMLGNFFPNSTQTETVGWDDIEVTALESYLEEGVEMGYIDLSSSEYSEFFVSGDLVDETDFDEVTSEAVFEYIDENVEDPSYILE